MVVFLPPLPPPAPTVIPIAYDLDANSLWIGVGLGFTIGVLLSVVAIGAFHHVKELIEKRREKAK